jgi:hypothetical protein
MVETPINRDRVLKVAMEASDRFVKGAAESPDAAILEVIGSATPYSRRQLDRIAQATNQAVWAKLAASMDPSKVRFPLASGAALVMCLQKTAAEHSDPPFLEEGPDPRPWVSPEALPENLRARLEAQLGLDQIKLASSTPSLVFPTNANSWHRISTKLKRASEEVQDRRHIHSWQARHRLYEMVKEARALLNQKIDPGVILGAVRRAIPDREAGMKIAAYLHQEVIEKHFDPLAHAREIFGSRVARGAGKGGLPSRLLEKHAAKVPETPSWGLLNTQHPLCQLAIKVAEDLKKSCLLEKTAENLEEQARHAFKLACANVSLV